jgi:hypothetical protein
VFIGEGIPLFGVKRRMVELKLAGLKKFSDGVTEVRYEVGKGR